MIRIINGTYGYRNPITNQVEAKTAKSKPFSIDADRERELVKAGVAEYVGKDTDQDGAGQNDGPNKNQQPQKQEDQIPKYSTKNSVAELTALAEKLGVNVKDGATKKEIVAAIDAALAQGNKANQDEHDDQDGAGQNDGGQNNDQDGDDEGDDDDAPNLSAAMPE